MVKTNGTHKVTPDALFRWANARYGPFTLDAAASPDNAKCPQYFTDALPEVWTGRVWLNPPWDNIRPFVAKAHESVFRAETADLVCMLLPTRSGQSWWHELVEPYAEKKFIRGRIKFGRTTTDDGGRGGFEDCGLFVFERALQARDLNRLPP